jgi:hypothetical protein
MVTPARPRSRPGRGAEPGRRVPAGRAALDGWPPPAPYPPYPPYPPYRPDGSVRPSLPPLPPRAYGPSAAARAAALRRIGYRRRRAAVLAVLLVAAGLVLTDVVRTDLTRDRAALAPPAAEPAAEPAARRTAAPAGAAPRATRAPRAPRPAGRPATAASPGRPPAAAKPGRSRAVAAPAEPVPERAEVPFPVSGPGRFAYAAGRSSVFGMAGPLRRYRVAVEQGTGQRADEFARTVDGTLGDRRSWIGSGRLRLRRVPVGEPAQFTVFLATPGTSERMCAAGGLRTERFTSCRLPGRVVINLARWWLAVPGYGAPLAEYRAYAVNHEVGHELGRGHEACPGIGRPAPVMQQQTLGLHGCLANGWPYVAGRRYAGPPVP